MEPMTLGSPVGSPSSADSLLKGQTTAPQYLPGYLMGDTSSLSSSRMYQPGTSPKKYTKTSLGLGIHAGSPPSFSLTSSTPNQPARLGRQEKPGGPPVQKLFNTSAANLSFQDTSLVAATPVPSTPHLSFGSSVIATPLSTANGVEASNDTWVTIFGFPPSAASFILSQAAQWGNVADHRIPPQGNWMHLKFASKIQAKKALTRNGKVFGETIMIGVVPCTDSDIVDEQRKENFPVVSSTSAVSSPRDTSVIVASPNTTTATLDRSGMRPLTQAFKQAHADFEVVQRGRTPQKNTSLVSKAMDYVFGW